MLKNVLIGDTVFRRIDAKNRADAEKAATLFPELQELLFIEKGI